MKRDREREGGGKDKRKRKCDKGWRTAQKEMKRRKKRGRGEQGTDLTLFFVVSPTLNCKASPSFPPLPRLFFPCCSSSYNLFSHSYILKFQTDSGNITK